MLTRRLSSALIVTALLPLTLQGGNYYASQLPYITYYTGQPGVTPHGMTFSPQGNLVYADPITHVVFMRDKTVTYAAGNPGAGISILAGTSGISGSSGDGGLPAGALLNAPTDVKYDPAGNLYIYESGSGNLRVVNYQATAQTFSGVTVQPGQIGTVLVGHTGVSAIAIDSTGKVYLASFNQTISTLSGAGVVTTLFGSGIGGFGGDGGPATSDAVQFSLPSAMAFDNTGNLYIGDAGNCVVRMINMTGATVTRFTLTIAAGNIQTVAGSPYECGATDNLGSAIESIAVDAVGNLYIADASNHAVRFADRLSGGLSTIVGLNILFPTPNGLAINDAFYVTSIALDPLDNLYAGAANNTYKVSTTNPVSQAIVGQSSSGTLAFLANVYLPNVVISSNNPAFVYNSDATCEGQVLEYPAACYVPITFTPSSPGVQTAQLTINSDCDTVTIAVTGIGVGPQVAIIPGTISTVAGNGTQSTAPNVGNGGPATSAELDGPASVAFNGAGNMYIGDSDGAQVREVIASTGTIFTFAGTGTAGFTGFTSSPASANLALPGGVAVDASGNIFIAEQANNQVVEWNPTAGFLYGIVGNGTLSSTGDGGPAVAATIDQPPSVTADLAGNLYIPDAANRVRMVKAADGVVTGSSVIVTLAGNGSPVFSGDGGLAVAAGTTPAQVAVDTLGNLYIADILAGRIRKITSATGIITTVAGNGSGTSSGDGGPAISAGIVSPSGVAVDAAGNIYIADGSGLIRKVSVATGLISTIAGNGSNQELGDGGPATSAGIDTSGGQLAFDAAGNLYLAERTGHRIRKISINSPALNFGSVPQSSTSTAQSVQVVNNGNAAYNLAALTVSAPFAEKAAAAATDCRFTGDSIGMATLAPGQSCNLSLTFTPTGTGVQTGTAAFIGQSIPLTGTGTNLPTVTTFIAPPASSIYGQSATFTVQVTANGIPVTSGSVTFVDASNGNALLAGNVGMTLGSSVLIATTLAAGSHTILATYNAGATFLTSNNSATITVAKKMLTVAAGVSAPSKTYGGAGPLTGITISGFVNNDNSGSNNPLIVTPATALSIGGAVTGEVILTVTNASTVVVPAISATTPAGAYTLTPSPATGEGALLSSNYSFGFFVPVSFTVNQASLNVTANPASAVYGAPIPSLTYQINGFVNEENSSVVSGAALVTTTAAVGSPAGQYAITPAMGSLSAANYTFNFFGAQLTIGKAMLTVAATPVSATYGSAIPALTYAITGFVNNDMATAVSGAPIVTTTATPSSALGQYPITVTLGTLSAVSYNFGFTGAQVTVGKAMLTVTANPVSATYGSAIPALTYAITGFVNNDTATVVSGTPVITTTAMLGSPAGQYSITAALGSLSAPNYNFCFTGAQLTIGKATLTVTASAVSTSYGAAIPPLTYTTTGFVNNDLASVVSGTANLTTTAIVGSAAGQYAITPHAGSLSAVNYTFSFINGQLTIGKVMLTVTANAVSSSYGAAIPALTYAITGFVNSDAASVVSGIPIVTTTATPSSATGQYPITVTLGSLSAINYNFSFTGAQLSIGKAMLTVTANPVSAIYGSAIPALTYAITGFVNSDPGAVVSGAPVIATTAIVGSAAGQYPITVMVGTLSAANYNFGLTGAQVTVGKATLTVTANAVSTSYGAPIPPLTYTITGFVNGDLASVVSGAAILTTTAIVGSPAGQCAITPHAGSLSAVNYTFSFINGQLTIGKVMLTVTANAVTSTYGAAIPALTYAITGFVNNDTVTVVSGAPGIGTTAIMGSAAGQYPITVTLGSLSAANYSFTFTGAQLSVGKAMLTVTANPVSASYGAAIPALTYAITGLVNSDSGTVVTGTPLLTTMAIAGSATGQYPITVSLGTLSAVNYNFAFTGAQLTIGKATLTVTANPVSAIYGAAIPTLTYAITGFVNGDLATVASGTATLSTAAIAGSPAGQYPITATQGTLSAANYTFTFTGAQVTIGKAILTVTANPVSATYGSAIPALTYAISGFVNSDAASVVSGIPTVTTTATPSSATGLYPITMTLGSLSAINYTFSFTGAQLTIGKATLTVTANPVSASYGAVIPALTYAITGFVNGDTAAAVSGAPALSTTATSSSVPAAGQYAITASQGTLSAANYIFTLTGAQLTIGKATLIVTAKTLSAIYGAGIPALTYAIGGFVDGDTAAAVSGAPALSTTATSSSAAGQYPITASQGTLAAANYIFTFTGAQVTIGKALLTVTANAISVGYGAAIPVLTDTITGFVNGDTATAVTGTVSLTTTASQGSAAGQYPITVSQGTLSAANYNFTFTSSQLTIGMATSTAVAILAPGGSEPVGTSFTVTFSVPQANGGSPPTGIFAYSVDSGATQTVPLGLTGSAAIALPGLGVGSHSIAAAYNGDNNYSAATATTLRITVTKAASSVVITVFNNGTANVVVASTTPTPSSPSPSGSVSCSLNGAAAVVTALSGSSATLTFSSAAPGSYTISCNYSGDSNFTASGPVSAALVIPKLSQSVTAATDFAGSFVPAGQSFMVIVDFTLPPGTAIPTGAVEVSVNGGAPQTLELISGAATVSMAGLAAGAYTIAVTYAGDSNYSASTASLNITATSTTPLVPEGGLESGALSTVNLSPGSWATMFGGNLSVTTATAAQLPLTTNLGGASVTLNGEACPLDYVSPTQINFQVPYDIPVGLATVVVSTSAGVGAPFTAVVTAAAPAVFTYIDSGGTREPIVLHGATLALVSASSPAQAGETLVLYATGAGPVTDQPATGAAAGAGATSVVTPTVTVGGASTTVAFAGLSQGSVGLFQINFILPATLPAGSGTPLALPLVISLPGNSSPAVNLFVSM